MNTRRKVSCEGMPCFNVRKLLSHASLLLAYRAISSQLSAQAITRTVGHDQNLDQVVRHFVRASGIVYLGKGVEELFEQDDSSNHVGMATLL